MKKKETEIRKEAANLRNMEKELEKARRKQKAGDELEENNTDYNSLGENSHGEDNDNKSNDSDETNEYSGSCEESIEESEEEGEHLNIERKI